MLFGSTILSFVEGDLMATYYVSIQTGDDTNDGLSPETAWATITKAAQTMVAGDRVYVAPGTYYETVQPLNFGEPDAWISYIADTNARHFPFLPPGPVIISGLDSATALRVRDYGIVVHSYRQTSSSGVTGQFPRHWIFDGFTITDVASYAIELYDYTNLTGPLSTPRLVSRVRFCN